MKNTRTGLPLLSLLFFAYLGFGQSISNLPPAIGRQVDSVFADWSRPGVPGGSVAIIQNGRVILEKGYGLANLRHNTPNTPQTAFNVASIAKQFTAMCIALLEEQGKLSFDDDIRTYFPTFQIREKLTVRHLLTHTSGLREAYVLAVLSGKINLKGSIRRKYNTTGHMVALMASQKDLNFKPGDEHAYTNINYVLLGEIVRIVSGLSLREFADRHIFQPLGMTHTFFNDVISAQPSSRATPYWPRRKKPERFKSLSPTDGGIVGDHNLITTVSDLILWDQNFFHNRLGKQDTALLEKMQTRYILNSGDTIVYAFGLNVHPYKNYLSVGHGGDDSRYTSSMVRFPNQKLSIICLANTSRYNNTEEKVFALADRLLTIQTPPKDTTKPAYSFLPLNLSYFKDKAGHYTGISRKNRYWFRQVLVKENKVYLAFRPNKALRELLPIAGDHFLFKVDEPDKYIEAWFTKSATGEIHLHEKFKNDTLRFRLNAAPASLASELRKYAGVYANDETRSRMKVKVRRESLLITFRGIIRIKTIPVGASTFYAADNQAFFRFHTHADGQPKEFTIDAPDFRNIRFVRSGLPKQMTAK